jgi:hypothetical protein
MESVFAIKEIIWGSSRNSGIGVCDQRENLAVPEIPESVFAIIPNSVAVPEILELVFAIIPKSVSIPEIL